MPATGEEVACRDVSDVPGGTGANAAVAAARILGQGQVALFGALGNDQEACLHLKILTDEGVDCSRVVQISNARSGHAYIFVDRAGQNMIASDLGANEDLDVPHINETRVAGMFKNCECLALTDPPLVIVSKLLKTAAKLGVPAMWDPGWRTAAGWHRLSFLMRYVDSLLLNQAEAVRLFGTGEPAQILGNLEPTSAPRTIVLKRGGQGSLLIECDTGTIREVPALPLAALGLSTVSTVGCGDVFLGVAAACRAQGLTHYEALLWASAAAGVKATRQVTRGGPTGIELHGILHAAQAHGFPGDMGASSR